MRLAERLARFTTRWRASNKLNNRSRIAVIAAAATGSAAAIASIFEYRTRIEAWSTASAYVAITLLAITLVLGPIKVLRKSHNPVHSVTRRDLGIAAGITAIIHTVLGLQVHMNGNLIRYFTLTEGSKTSGVVFVGANYLGLAGAAILLALVGISNNVAIRKLGLETWKRMQRYAYVAAVLSVTHGFLYQLLEKRVALLSMLALTSALLIVLQLRGARARRSSR